MYVTLVVADNTLGRVVESETFEEAVEQGISMVFDKFGYLWDTQIVREALDTEQCFVVGTAGVYIGMTE